MKRRVLVVIETLGRDGGAENFLHDILPRLTPFGLDFDIVALYGPYDLAQGFQEKGISTFKVNAWHRWFLPQSLLKILWQIRGRHYDVIWSHLYFANLHGALLSLIYPNVKLITIIHSTGYLLNPPRRLWDQFRMRLEQFIGLFLFDRIFAMSSATAEDYQSQLGWRNIEILPHGIPLDAMPEPLDYLERRALRKEYGLGEGDFCFVSVARLSPQKGLKYLIAALERLANQGLRPHCVIFGKGGLEAALTHQIATAGLGETVKIYAPIPHERLLRSLRAFDAFVLPSIFEPQGIAAGEAMALGLPCILSDVEGLRIWPGTQGAALMVKPGDPDALAACLMRVISDSPLREQLSAAGAERIAKEFSFAENTERWARVLNEA